MNAQPPSLRRSEHYRRWYTPAARPASWRGNSLRWALIVWLLLAAAVSVRTLLRPSSHTVFPIFAASAAHWWADQALYQPDLILDRFRYPPVFALFATPFSALGLVLGGVLWSWLSMAIFVAGLGCYVRDVLPSVWPRRRTALFVILGALGALRGLWNAQSNALIVGLLLLGVAALARALASSQGQRTNGRAWWLAALLLALPVCLKLTPLAPVLLLAALWPRRLAGRLIVIVAALFLLPFLTRPYDIVLSHYHEWIDHLMESGNIRWIGFRDGWTIWIVLRHWLNSDGGALALCEPMDGSWYHLLQLATAASVLAWCLWQQRRAVRLDLGSRWLVHVVLSMGLAWLMLFGPAVEHASYVFLTPPLVWALLERRAWPHGQGLILAAFALIMVFGWGAVTRLSPNWPILLTALPAGTALFTLWLFGYAENCRSRREMAPETLGCPRFPFHKPQTPCLEQRDEATISL